MNLLVFVQEAFLFLYVDYTIKIGQAFLFIQNTTCFTMSKLRENKNKNVAHSIDKAFFDQPPPSLPPTCLTIISPCYGSNVNKNNHS